MSTPADGAPAVAIGIAGWSYADWKGVVYPAGCKDTLRYCLRFVDCIEINSSFYRIPLPQTCASWAKRTAELPGFFTAKLPRVFTHEGRVEDADVDAVRAGFAPLRAAGRLRAWLAQFSYRFTAAEENRWHLARIVDAVSDLAPVVVEVRHRSWMDAEALDFLSALGVSVAQLDYPGSRSGFASHRSRILGDAQLAYYRLHGRNYRAWFRKDAGRDEVYDYDYSEAEVGNLVGRVHALATGAAQTVVIANNHFHGQAMKVALELAAALRGGRVDVPEPLLTAFPALARIVRGAQPGLFG